MPSSAGAGVPAERIELAGASVLLSGATGVVGARVLARLVDAGARVAIAARKPWQVERLNRDTDPSATLVGLVPAGDGEAAAGFVKGAIDSLGPIDAFVSAAGAFAAHAAGRDPAGTAQGLLEANFLAVHDLVRAVAGPMIRRKTGSLVFTGAVAVGAGLPGAALYAASKAALHEYARSLAIELRPCSIHVTVIAPGTIDTDANRSAAPDVDPRERVPVERVVDALLAAACERGPTDGDPVRPVDA